MIQNWIASPLSLLAMTIMGENHSSESRFDRDDSLDLDRNLIGQHDITAERACRPASPKTSTNRSEQPLMTFGESLKSGEALTMPRSLTMKSTRSSEPSASRMAASKPNPTSRARR